MTQFDNSKDFELYKVSAPEENLPTAHQETTSTIQHELNQNTGFEGVLFSSSSAPEINFIKNEIKQPISQTNQAIFDSERTIVVPEIENPVEKTSDADHLATIRQKLHEQFVRPIPEGNEAISNPNNRDEKPVFPRIVLPQVNRENENLKIHEVRTRVAEIAKQKKDDTPFASHPSLTSQTLIDPELANAGKIHFIPTGARKSVGYNQLPKSKYRTKQSATTLRELMEKKELQKTVQHEKKLRLLDRGPTAKSRPSHGPRYQNVVSANRGEYGGGDRGNSGQWAA